MNRYNNNTILLTHARPTCVLSYYCYLSKNRLILPLLTLIDDDDASGWFVTPISRHCATSAAACIVVLFVRVKQIIKSVKKRRRRRNHCYFGVFVDRGGGNGIPADPLRFIQKNEKNKNVGCYFSPRTHTHTHLYYYIYNHI